VARQKFYAYKLLINEVGEILGVPPANMPLVATATEGLMLMRTRMVAPGILGAEATPSACRLDFSM
jgi:hypothetical protein